MDENKRSQIDYKAMITAYKEIGAVFFIPGSKPEFSFFDKQLKKMDKKEFNERKRQYHRDQWYKEFGKPTTAEEAFSPMPEAMFPIIKLREAYDYYVQSAEGVQSARGFFEWLNTLVKDIPFNHQRCQP